MMGGAKNWCYEWIQRHIEENENGTATVTLDDQKSKLHFPSAEAAEKYLWEHEADDALADELAHEMDVGKNKRKYG